MPSKSSTNTSEAHSIYDQPNGNTLTVLGKDGKAMDYALELKKLKPASQAGRVRPCSTRAIYC